MAGRIPERIPVMISSSGDSFPRLWVGHHAGLVACGAGDAQVNLSVDVGVGQGGGQLGAGVVGDGD